MGKFSGLFGGGRRQPQPDYAAIQRQQEAERKRLQGIRDEEFRVDGIKDYVDYMYDNPENVKRRSATGSFYGAISEGKVPNELLSGYASNKDISLKDVKANTSKYFTNRDPVPSIQKGRIKLGKRAIKRPEGVLGGAGDDTDKKTLLGA
jgi:hypothetical protein